MMMKNFIIIFIGCFIANSTFGLDISDYKVSGMTIGDSALDRYSKNEILNNRQDHYIEGSKYNTSAFYLPSEEFDQLQIHYLANDENFIIKGITKAKLISNFNECKKLISEIEEDIQKYSNLNKLQQSSSKSDDEIRKTTTINYWFEKTRDLISISCQDWSESIEQSHGFHDNLRIGYLTKDYNQFLNSKPFK